MHQCESPKNKALQTFLQQLLCTHKRPTCCFKENGDIVQASPNFLELFEANNLEIAQKHFEQSMHPSQQNNTPLDYADTAFYKQLPITLENDFIKFTQTHAMPCGQNVSLEYCLSHIHYAHENIIICTVVKHIPLEENLEIQSLLESVTESTYAAGANDANIVKFALPIVNASPTGISLWSEERQIIACNTVFLQMFGMNSLEEYKQIMPKFIPEFQPCGTPSVKFGQIVLERAFQEGYAYIEWVWQDNEGKKLPSMITLRRISSGAQTFVVGYVYDLRELESIKKIAKEADERIQIMWDSMPLGATFWNKDFEVVDCNLVVARLFGFESRQEFLDSYHKLSPEFQPNGRNSVEYYRELLAKVFREGYAEVDWKHMTINGETVSTHMTLIRTEYRGENVVLNYINDLTELKASHKATNEALAYSKAIFDTVPLGITLWNEDLEMFDCNQEVVRIFDLQNKEEYFNKIISFAPEFQPNGERSDEVIWQKLNHAFEVGYHTFEWMYLDREGNPLPLQIVLVRSKLDGEKIVIAYVIELRKLKQAEQRRFAAEKLNQILMDSIPLSVNIWAKEFNLLHCNSATLKLFGFNTKQEFLQSFYKLHPEVQPDGGISSKRIVEDFSLAFREGHHKVTWVHRKKDGSLFPAEKTMVRASHLGKDILLIFTRDLSEYIVSQNRERDIELRNELILDSLPIGVHFWDENKNLIYTNLTAAHLFGFESKEDYIRDFQTAFPEFQPDGTKSVDYVDSTLDKAYNNDYIVAEFLGKNPFTEELIPAEVSIKRGMYRGKVGITVYVRDLRELKAMLREIHETEIDLRAAKKNAEKSSLAKSEFLANISHEIHTPMHGILGLLCLLNGTKLLPDQKDYVHQTLFSANNLLATLNDILDFSKIEAGKLEMKSTTFTLEELYADTKEMHDPLCMEKNITLDLDHTGHAEFEKTVLVGDMLRLKQVLFNLIHNAIKFTSSGFVQVRTECTPLEGNSMQCLFSVRDTGVGLEQEELNHIFSAFSQTKSSLSQNRKSSNLGLAISRALVKMMHGDIWVQSVKDQGSTFFFTAIFAVAQQAQKYDPHKSKTSLARAHILLVEDNDMQQYAIKQMLKQAGYSLDIAKHGQEALKMLDNNHYDLMLMDMHMPVMDGGSTAQHIREHKELKNLPIIGMSKNDTSKDKEICITYGMNDHIEKPINPTILYQTLRQWLKKIK